MEGHHEPSLVAEPVGTILIKDGSLNRSKVTTCPTGIVGIDRHKNEVKMAITQLSFGSFLRFQKTSRRGENLVLKLARDVVGNAATSFR